MRIYLRERPEVFPGVEAKYAEQVETVVYPMMAKVEVGMRPVGFFRVHVTYGQWPRIGILWAYDGGWESVARSNSQPRDVQAEPAMIEWLEKANQWRERSTERMLIPVPFSPQPPPLPQRTSPGSVLLDQRIALVRGRSSEFLETFESGILPQAAQSGLRLELLARAAGRLNELYVLWSVPSWDDWARVQEQRQSEDDFLPGIEKSWSDIEDFEEETLEPWPFSPLGGTRQAEMGG
jgi:hypothetical protein